MKILSNYIKTAGVLLAVILAGSCTDHDEVREKTNTLKWLRTNRTNILLRTPSGCSP